jgi:hypothetical protein
MLRFQPVVSTAAAALLLIPVARFSPDDLAVLQGALDEIEHALEVLNGLVPRVASGEEGASALVRSVTEGPLPDAEAADQHLEQLRDEVNLLQAELDVLEARPLMVETQPAPLGLGPKRGGVPPISTGLTDEQRALLSGGDARPQGAPAAAGAGASAGPGRPDAVRAAAPAGEEGYSADPMRHAEACLRAGRYKEGFTLIAARTDPTAVYLQARLLEKLGRLEEAIAALDSVVGKLPEGYEARRAQSDLEFFKWKRDFLKRMPPESAQKQEAK